MAWRCSGILLSSLKKRTKVFNSFKKIADSNEELIDNLRDASIISNERVVEAMKAVDR
jgi:hypothetical protein